MKLLLFRPKRWLAIALLISCTIFLSMSFPVTASEAQTQSDLGQTVFETVCAGCHANGGNVIRRGKNLRLRTLQRHKKDNVAAIANVVRNGQGIMSAYSDRLSEEEINAVARYVLQQANNNWQ